MDIRYDRSLQLGDFIAEADDDLLICRCEEISKGEIRQAIHEGMVTLTEIKRYLRAGMGLCQGQTCGKLVKRLVARELGMSPECIDPGTSRAPIRPLEMKVLSNEKGRCRG